MFVTVGPEGSKNDFFLISVLPLLLHGPHAQLERVRMEEAEYLHLHVENCL